MFFVEGERESNPIWSECSGTKAKDINWIEQSWWRNSKQCLPQTCHKVFLAWNLNFFHKSDIYQRQYLRQSHSAGANPKNSKKETRISPGPSVESRPSSGFAELLKKYKKNAVISWWKAIVVVLPFRILGLCNWKRTNQCTANFWPYFGLFDRHEKGRNLCVRTDFLPDEQNIPGWLKEVLTMSKKLLVR